MVFGFKLWSKKLKKNKMNDSGVKKLVQITEEAQKPVHIPIVFGNECFVVTQQDVRKIEDTRLLTYSKLAPNGQLIPVESLGHNANITEAILNACKYRMQIDQNAATTDVNLLLELLNRICGKQSPNLEIGNIENMQQQQPACVATLEQQLQWAKTTNNSSEPFPFTYNTATSTVDITSNKETSTQKFSNDCCCCCCCNGSNKSKTVSQSRGSNTMETGESSRICHHKDPPQSAREQLKQRKMTQDTSYSS